MHQKLISSPRRHSKVHSAVAGSKPVATRINWSKLHTRFRGPIDIGVGVSINVILTADQFPSISHFTCLNQSTLSFVIFWVRMVKGDRQERCLPSIHLRCRPCHRHLTTFSQGVHSAFAIAMGVHSALSVQCISFPTCRLCRRLNHTDQRHIQQAKSVRVGVADTTTQAQAQALHRLVSRGSPRPAVPCRGEPSISAAPSKHHPKAVQFARPVSHLLCLPLTPYYECPVATTAHKHTRTRRGCLLSLPAFPLLCSPLPARALGSCIAPPSTEMVAAAEWWEATIAAYTGLSPAAFFTAVAVAAALYVAVSGLLTRRPPPLPRRQEEARASQPLPPPVQLGEVTEEELRVYDGSDPNKPLLMAIKGQIYDVTQSR